MRLARREFLGALSATWMTPVALSGCSSGDRSQGRSAPRAFGPLVDDPDGVLRLPEGFRYVVLEKSGDTMSDDHPMGARPDGMACFDGPDDTWILMRNHENDLGVCAEPDVAFNPNMAGGVSRVVLTKELERVSSNWVLVGTNRNCAGGPSPWGWLTCEETEDIGHGFVFLCDVDAAAAKKPQRAPSLGRFKHEAVAIDPDTEVAYLTEDTNESALYRHVPEGGPFEGRLEALVIAGRPRFHLGRDLAVGDAFDVEWIEVPDPSAESEGTAAQVHELGAAIVVRGEGIWWGDGSVFFVATEGGPLQRGQVFRLDVATNRLTLVAQAEDDESFVNPDNITVSPTGEVFVVEDNDGPNRIWRVEEDGSLSLFGENVLGGGTSELCGVCFSPDGSTMFVNVQEQGYTLAISGPFSA